MMRLGVILACMLVLGTGRDAKAQEDPAVGLYAGLQQALLLLRVTADPLDPTRPRHDAFGTGFVVGPEGTVLTVEHILPDPSLYHPPTILGWFGMVPGSTAPYPLKLVKRTEAKDQKDKPHDAAMLQLDDPRPTLKFLSLGNPDDVPVGRRLYVLGYPLAQELRIVDGTLSGRSTGRWATDALIVSGYSGGPVVTREGSVVAIVTDGVTSIRSGNGDIPVAGVNFAVPLSAIPDLQPSLTPEALAQARAGVRIALPEPERGLMHIGRTHQHSRTKEDHPWVSSFVVAIDREDWTIHALPGHHFVSWTPQVLSFNPPVMIVPPGILSADRKTLTFSYNLVSGPAFSRFRGWMDMVVHTVEGPDG